MSTEMDRYLWEKSVAGDSAAFGEIFERHARAVYNYLFRRCGEWATAEDLTSTVFLEAWRRRAEVTLVNDSALPFLLGVAINVLRNRRRTEFRYRAALKRLPAPAEGLNREDDVVDRLEDEEMMRRVLHAFSQLPKREQDVVSLCVWADQTYEEAAAALDIPVGTVRSRLFRGRGRLRELIGGTGHEMTGNAKAHLG
jgi:RNA polymerase sigma-70 factor (ECF subfamily)